MSRGDHSGLLIYHGPDDEQMEWLKADEGFAIDDLDTYPDRLECPPRVGESSLLRSCRSWFRLGETYTLLFMPSLSSLNGIDNHFDEIDRFGFVKVVPKKHFERDGDPFEWFEVEAIEVVDLPEATNLIPPRKQAGRDFVDSFFESAPDMVMTYNDWIYCAKNESEYLGYEMVIRRVGEGAHVVLTTTHGYTVSREYGESYFNGGNVVVNQATLDQIMSVEPVYEFRNGSPRLPQNESQRHGTAPTFPLFARTSYEDVPHSLCWLEQTDIASSQTADKEIVRLARPPKSGEFRVLGLRAPVSRKVGSAYSTLFRPVDDYVRNFIGISIDKIDQFSYVTYRSEEVLKSEQTWTWMRVEITESIALVDIVDVLDEQREDELSGSLFDYLSDFKTQTMWVYEDWIYCYAGGVVDYQVVLQVVDGQAHLVYLNTRGVFDVGSANNRFMEVGNLVLTDETFKRLVSAKSTYYFEDGVARLSS